MLPASGNELRHQVPARGGMGRIEGAESPGVVKGESLMVPGGEDDIAHPRPPGEGGDSFAVEFLRGEGLHKLSVLGRSDPLVRLDPLPFAHLGVEPPVKEQSETQFLEGGHPGKRQGNTHFSVAFLFIFLF